MKKILMFVIMLLMSMTAFAGTTGVFETIKGFITVDNVLAGIGVVSLLMTATPVPKTGTVLWKVYNIVKYLGGNFGFADHTKKK